MNTLSSRSCWIWTSVFVLLMMGLWGSFIWLRLGPVATVSAERDERQEAVDQLAGEQAILLKPELQELFERYSDGMWGLDALFAARDQVFSGALDDEHDDPLVVLDLLDFLQSLQQLLGKQTILSNFSLSPSGRVSFLVETISYYQASQQMLVLRFGLKEEPLLSEVEISSVSRQPLTGDPETWPEMFQGLSTVYRFVVQAQVNPRFYELRQEQSDVLSGLNQ